MNYKLVNDYYTNSLSCIKATDSNGDYIIIPLDEKNVDYARYLAGVAEGNTAEAAD